MTPTLYKLNRVCSVCEAEAAGNSRSRLPSEPNIIAISFTIYRRGNGKGILKSAQRVQVCEECLIRALTGGRLVWAGGDKGGWKLWGAIRRSLLSRYRGMVEAEK
jgi:hypothetical protein